MQHIFMVSQNTRLKDRTPLEELRKGRLDNVLKAARAFGEHGARSIGSLPPPSSSALAHRDLPVLMYQDALFRVTHGSRARILGRDRRQSIRRASQASSVCCMRRWTSTAPSSRRAETRTANDHGGIPVSSSVGARARAASRFALDRPVGSACRGSVQTSVCVRAITRLRSNGPWLSGSTPLSLTALYYRAGHDPSRVSVALFDRAASAVSVVRGGNLLDDCHQPILAEILETDQFALL